MNVLQMNKKKVDGVDFWFLTFFAIYNSPKLQYPLMLEYTKIWGILKFSKVLPGQNWQKQYCSAILPANEEETKEPPQRHPSKRTSLARVPTNVVELNSRNSELKGFYNQLAERVLILATSIW